MWQSFSFSPPFFFPNFLTLKWWPVNYVWHLVFRLLLLKIFFAYFSFFSPRWIPGSPPKSLFSSLRDSLKVWNLADCYPSLSSSSPFFPSAHSLSVSFSSRNPLKLVKDSIILWYVFFNLPPIPSKNLSIFPNFLWFEVFKDVTNFLQQFFMSPFPWALNPLFSIFW